MATEPILPTKLYRAPPRPDRLPRPRLMARLAEALTRRLTLVSAPAGAGKTTLLSEWQVAAAGQGWLVAWVSLDAGDNDPPRFWGYCLAALSAQRPGLGQTALALLRARPSPPPRAILTALIADLAQVEHEVALILDDYHVVEAASIHEGVAFLVDHLPPRAHLVLSGRADPPLPLARLRARGELAELRAAELAFSADESAAFLERVLGPRLAAEDAAVLAARTEGWAAGLHLAALALQGRAGEDVRAFVQAFAGTHRYILDYLAEEVLEAQPAEVQEFLLLTAILDRLCGPLCDAVTGRRDGDGQELLESLERANLFLIPLDDERRWYRYHHLFADLLRARLRHRLAEGVPELHRRAAAWLERHQMVEEALRHLLAAGDEAAAAALVERHEVGTSARGEVAAVQRWVNALPPGLVRERPRLAVLAAAARVTAQELDQVEPHLRDAERALARLEAGRTPERPGSDSGLEEVPGRISFVRAALAASRDDSERAIEHARQALERLPAQSRFFRGVAAFNLATAYWANGDLPAAHQLFLELAGSAVPRGEEQMTLLARFALGQVLAIQGRLREAGETHRHTLRLVAERGGAVPPTTGVAHLGLGEVLREWDDLPAAARHAEAGVALCFGTGQSSLIVAAHVLLARVRLAAGDRRGAQDLFERAAQLAPAWLRQPPYGAPPWAHLARWWLAQGDVAAAARWVQQARLSPDMAPGVRREAELMTLVRVLLAQDQAETAMGLLERLLRAAEEGERWRSVVEALALRALAHRAQGNLSEARRALARALTLAEPEGYVRTFVDEGAPMAALLDEPATRAVAPEYVARLRAAFREQAPPAPPAPAAGPGMVEALSAREMEVLRLVDAGRSNVEIARALHVTPGTVKVHLRNIYGKLDARRRTEALARARALGLLPASAAHAAPA